MYQVTIRERAKFIWIPGRVYRQRGRHFFWKKKWGARTFFQQKKGGQVVFSSWKKGATTFFRRKKGGKSFIIDLKMGGQYFSWQHRWGSDLFHRKIIYHIFPNPGQGIEISKIGEVGALAFLIVSKLIGKIFQSRFTDPESSLTWKNLVSGGHVGNCCVLHESYYVLMYWAVIQNHASSLPGVFLGKISSSLCIPFL